MEHSDNDCEGIGILLEWLAVKGDIDDFVFYDQPSETSEK